MSRRHWLWFGPLAAAVLFITEAHTVRYGIAVAKLAYTRWDWGGFVSPSAYFCWAVVVSSCWFPLVCTSLAKVVLFEDNAGATLRRRRTWIVMAILATVLLLPFVTDALTWGSFPFNIDDTGAHRLRMIPFVPWPDGPFGSF